MNNVEKYTKNINILSQSVESTENVYLISEPKIKPKILLHLDPELTITLDPLSFKHFLKKYENQPILDKVYLFQQFRECQTAWKNGQGIRENSVENCPP
jgi:hypothetical protein